MHRPGNCWLDRNRDRKRGNARSRGNAVHRRCRRWCCASSVPTRRDRRSPEVHVDRSSPSGSHDVERVELASGWHVYRGLDLPLAVDIDKPVDEAAPIVYGLAVDLQSSMLESGSEDARRRDVEPQVIQLYENDFAGNGGDAGEKFLEAGHVTTVRAV